jgi:hypothetical protein
MGSHLAFRWSDFSCLEQKNATQTNPNDERLSAVNITVKQVHC